MLKFGKNSYCSSSYHSCLKSQILHKKVFQIALDFVIPFPRIPQNPDAMLPWNIIVIWLTSHCLRTNYHQIFKWNLKWANFLILYSYKCKPNRPNEITNINSILYFKMSLLSMHVWFYVFAFGYWLAPTNSLDENIFWSLHGVSGAEQINPN